MNSETRKCSDPEKAGEISVLLHDTPGLILFIGGYLRLKKEFLVPVVEFD